MRICSNCQSINVKQMSSVHTRILLSLIIVLNFYFFTGEIDYGALIALIPLFIPYYQKCIDCKSEFLGLPKIKFKNYWLGSISDKFLLAMIPSILTITLLILNFPNTGLGRIIYLPMIYFINSLIILINLNTFRNRNGAMNIVSWTIIISVTVILSVWSYPQEYGDGIIKMIFTKIS